ncbi:hypothetical protein PCE1_002506 [Barthelona sp. PCE]
MSQLDQINETYAALQQQLEQFRDKTNEMRCLSDEVEVFTIQARYVNKKKAAEEAVECIAEKEAEIDRLKKQVSDLVKVATQSSQLSQIDRICSKLDMFEKRFDDLEANLISNKTQTHQKIQAIEFNTGNPEDSVTPIARKPRAAPVILSSTVGLPDDESTVFVSHSEIESTSEYETISDKETMELAPSFTPKEKKPKRRKTLPKKM